MSYITKPYVPKDQIDPRKIWTLDFTFEINGDQHLMNQLMFKPEKEVHKKIIKWRKILQDDLNGNSFGQSTFIICKSMNASLDSLEELIRFREKDLPKLDSEQQFEIIKAGDLAVLKAIMVKEYQEEQARIKLENERKVRNYPKQMPGIQGIPGTK